MAVWLADCERKKTYLVEEEELVRSCAPEEGVEGLEVRLVAHESLKRVLRQPRRERVLDLALAPFMARRRLRHDGSIQVQVVVVSWFRSVSGGTGCCAQKLPSTLAP